MSADPAFRWVPPHTATCGDLAAEFGVHLGLPPDEYQRGVLDAIYAENVPGKPACFEVAVIAPRQNLKTACLMIAALSDLFVFGAERVIWTAHLYDTAQDAFKKMRTLIGKNPDLKAQVRWPPTTASGDEKIELLSGPAIEFHSRSTGAGRGFDGDVVILDEGLFLKPDEVGALMPVLATRDAAQIRYASSAGVARSEVLRAIRDRGRAGGDSDLAYFEWCAPHEDCADLRCAHSLGVEGCALDREHLRAAANPALGRRISRKRIGQFRRSMPPREFAREFLGWWDDPDVALAALPAESWRACGHPLSQIAGRPALAVSMTPDRSTVSLVAAGKRPDGQFHVEVVRHGRAGAWFVTEAVGVARRQGADVWLAPTHPVGSLEQQFLDAGLEPKHLTGTDYTQACGGFYDAVLDGRVHYLPPQPELDGAIDRATRKPTGEAWRWAGDDISALVAATQALWAAANNDSSGGWMVGLR